jgi:hypothetical protein
MSRQPLYKNAIRLATALALLVSVMISPIRPAPKVGGNAHLSLLDCLRSNLGIPSKATTNHRPHVPATSRVVQVKAVSSQSKLDLSPLPAGDDTHPVCPRPTVPPEQGSTALGTPRAIHPLRC